MCRDDSGRRLAMKAYYEARAREYDDWYLGVNLYADRFRPGWEDELDALRRTLEALAPARTLDVACGTGFLTLHLPGDVVGLDQSETMIEVARERVPDAEFVIADALELPFPDLSFDRVFTGHFYGHLDGAHREAFLAEARRVAPQLVVVDSALNDETPAERMDQRVLADGSKWEIYKRWFSGPGLAAELGGGAVLHEGRYFVAVEA
jgi:ubiquinone/menaquinone biosynthesis C-methylase UbiE